MIRRVIVLLLLAFVFISCMDSVSDSIIILSHSNDFKPVHVKIDYVVTLENSSSNELENVIDDLLIDIIHSRIKNFLMLTFSTMNYTEILDYISSERIEQEVKVYLSTIEEANEFNISSVTGSIIESN